MKIPRREFLHLAAGATAFSAISRIAWAQAYPTRPVRLVATYPAGGSADIHARLIGQSLSERLGQPFIIENRPPLHHGSQSIGAVNVSLVQLKNENKFIELVGETLAKWGLAPTDLEIDVTESMLAYFALAQHNVLERLQKLGVTIAIDDFGTKYSSLDYLRSYHVGRLKIPQLMVDSAAHDPNSAAMVRAIVGIARELNIEVVAQGVETKEQWSFLTTKSPVTKVQGYYYSEPVPAKRAEELLRHGQITPAASHATHFPEAPRRKRALQLDANRRLSTRGVKSGRELRGLAGFSAGQNIAFRP